MSRGAVLISISLLAGCTPATDTFATSEQAIYGGKPAPTTHAVFMVQSGGAFCTATLIAPRTLITAASCLNPEYPLEIASNPPSTGEVFFITEQTPWYEISPDAGDVDLALLHLDRAPAVAPQPIDPWFRYPTSNQRVRVVGYGYSDDTLRFGVRLSANAYSQRVDIEDYGRARLFIERRGLGTCAGDYGGPVLQRALGDEPEYLLSVSSYNQRGSCGEGQSVSEVIAPQLGVLAQWLSTHEAPLCIRDQRCVENCAQTDPDCVCAADGMCRAECIDFLDPDCPFDCRANGICAKEVCPGTDPDCAAYYAPCWRDSQCAGGRCINDPQNPNLYCSHSCSLGCEAGTQCDTTRDVCIKAQLPEVKPGGTCSDGVSFCAGEMVCGGGVCQPRCWGDAWCAAGETCLVDQEPSICVPREETSVSAPVLPNEYPAASVGCSSAPGVGWLAIFILSVAPKGRSRRMPGR